MLTIPEVEAPFKVLGVDPGSQNLGIALLHHPVDREHYIVDFATTIQFKEKYIKNEGDIENIGYLNARLIQMTISFAYWLNITQPQAVCIEHPFVGRSVKSYGVLVQVIEVIRQTVYRHDPFIPFITISPIDVKKTAQVNMRGKSDKLDVETALKAREDITWNTHVDMLDEHAFDAVCIAMHYLENIF